MKKFKYILFIVMFNLMFINTVSAETIDIVSSESSYGNYIESLSMNSFASTKCEGDDGLLGDPTDANDTAYYLQTALDILRYIAIVALIGLSSIDYMKAVTSSDADALKNTNSKTLKRLIYTVILFVFPIILEFLFDLTGIYGGADPFCGLE